MDREEVPFKYPAAFGDFSKPSRYRIWHGGRGGAKSWTVARVLAIMAAGPRPIRVLCCREYQNSIQDSVKRLLTDQIYALGLELWYDIQDKVIRSSSGSEFLFKGLARNYQGIKSTEGVDICWVEEAQTISAGSLELLIPTIRKDGSELWFTYNPEKADDPMHALTRDLQGNANALVKQVNWYDNPWFPAGLEIERQRMEQNDPEAYEHVWNGGCRTISAAVIFRNRVEFGCDFEAPADTRFFYGADWGFSNDPTALTRCFIHEDVLHIDYEAGGIGIEMDELPTLFDQVPGSRMWPIKADCARPETISFMANKYGYKISGAEKWSGSVEDGIARMKAFRGIKVHHRCPKTAQEFRLYSYKVDKQTRDILPVIDDRWNHYIDSIRYGLAGIIQNRRHMPMLPKGSVSASFAGRTRR